MHDMLTRGLSLSDSRGSTFGNSSYSDRDASNLNDALLTLKTTTTITNKQKKFVETTEQTLGTHLPSSICYAFTDMLNKYNDQDIQRKIMLLQILSLTNHKIIPIQNKAAQKNRFTCALSIFATFCIGGVAFYCKNETLKILFAIYTAIIIITTLILSSCSTSLKFYNMHIMLAKQKNPGSDVADTDQAAPDTTEHATSIELLTEMIKKTFISRLSLGEPTGRRPSMSLFTDSTENFYGAGKQNLATYKKYVSRAHLFFWSSSLTPLITFAISTQTTHKQEVNWAGFSAALLSISLGLLNACYSSASYIAQAHTLEAFLGLIEDFTQPSQTAYNPLSQ